jgi:hypothetical protein
MTDQPSPPFRIAPLRRLTAEPITDPAEQAALDELRKGPAERPRVRTRGGVANKVRFSEFLDLIHALSAEDQLQLAEKLVALLPADALQVLEAQLRSRLGGPPQG